VDYRPITKVVIVGGGTAGWMAAAFLESLFNSPAGRPVSITLVESPNIGTIGVGEATVPTLKDTLRIIGIGEKDFLKTTNATFKHAIKFRNWRLAPGDDANEHYYHPFDPPGTASGLSVAPIWSEFRRRGGKMPFAYFASTQPWLCEDGRCPQTDKSKEYASTVRYAYHTDASLLGQMLSKTAMTRGVEQVLANVSHVDQDEHGYITAVRTEDGREIAGDFFFDCTGFRGLLVNKTLKGEFVGYGDELLCDRAVTMRVPYKTPDTPIKPFTTATAQEAGWIWDIGLNNRNGFGYVYSGSHIDDDAAEATLRAYTGDLDGDHTVNRLRMRVGRTKKAWVKNCIALGLAGGFIEPLESTGIYLVEYGLKAFYDNLVTRGFNQQNVDYYNALMEANYEELRDFVQLHYILSERKDTDFWKDNVANTHISDDLRARLERITYKGMSVYEENKVYSLFGSANWFYIFTGLGHRPQPPADMPPLMEDAHIKNMLIQLKKSRENALRTHPSHNAYLKTIHEGTAPEG